MCLRAVCAFMNIKVITQAKIVHTGLFNVSRRAVFPILFKSLLNSPAKSENLHIQKKKKKSFTVAGSKSDFIQKNEAFKVALNQTQHVTVCCHWFGSRLPWCSRCGRGDASLA